MIQVLYSYGINVDADSFGRFLAGVRSDLVRFTPFDHRRRLDGKIYEQAYRLDLDWRAGDRRLRALYASLERALAESGADVLAVDNDNVYHPEFLRTLPVYRVLLSTDDPTSSYARTVPYLHAFDHVTTVTPLYNERVRMHEWLHEMGARRHSLKPIGVTPFTYDPSLDEGALFARRRDIDVVFIGAYYWQKSVAFRRMFRRLGRRLVVHGFWDWKAHAKYFRDTRSLRRVTPVSNAEMVSIYQRAKVGINLHTDEFSLGNMRLFQLPANGVAQVSDCASTMSTFFEPGREILTFDDIDRAVDLVLGLLEDEPAREQMARSAYRRTMTEYTFEHVWEKFAIALHEHSVGSSRART